MTNPCPYCLTTDDRHEQSCPNERRTIRFDDGVPDFPGDTEPVTQHCPNCAKLAKEKERAENSAMRFQQHRDAWRCYAYGEWNGEWKRPTDYLDDFPRSSTEQTRLERLEAALQEIEAILPIRIALMPASTALDMQHIARQALAGQQKEDE